MNETEFRHRLFDLAKDAPSGSSAPPALLRRARRRVVLTIASSVAIVVLVIGMGIAGVRALQAAPTPADPPTPTPTPGSLGALAYGVDGDIYVADWDGSNASRIADGRPRSNCHDIGEYWGEGPLWSPDGRYLAYRRTDCEPPWDKWWDVVISDAEGNVVATFPGAGWQIAWSPDSTRVAVWARFEETIGIYGLDGKRQIVLTLPPHWEMGGDVDPVWSPDGRSLLVADNAMVPIDGSTPLTVRHFGWLTTFSPDGSRVAYPAHGSLVVADAEGSQPREVFGDSVWKPVWSPTGDRIAFASAHQVGLVDVATGRVTILAAAEGSDGLRVIDFSRNRILFSRWTGSDASLWSVNADGSDLRRLVTGTLWDEWTS